MRRGGAVAEERRSGGEEEQERSRREGETRGSGVLEVENIIGRCKREGKGSMKHVIACAELQELARRRRERCDIGHINSSLKRIRGQFDVHQRDLFRTTLTSNCLQVKELPAENETMQGLHH